MAKQNLTPREENLAAFQTPEAVADFSVYRLFPEESYLFPKYYKPGDSILDLACGLGRTTLLLYEAGCKVKGVDVSDVFVRTAKRRFPMLDIELGSFDDIHEADESFDHVLISFNGIDCAHPEAMREKALAEAVRILKPGGTLIFSSHNVKSLHFFSPFYRNRLAWKARYFGKAFRDGAYIREDGIIHFFASRQTVIAQTERLGMRLMEMVAYNRLGQTRLGLYFSPYIHYAFRKRTAGDGAAE